MYFEDRPTEFDICAVEQKKSQKYLQSLEDAKQGKRRVKKNLSDLD